jgi:hypothetical protein
VGINANGRGELLDNPCVSKTELFWVQVITHFKARGHPLDFAVYRGIPLMANVVTLAKDGAAKGAITQICCIPLIHG